MGRVVTNFDELSLLTDYIIERYDTLPRVEESEPLAQPSLEVKEVTAVDGGAKIKFETDSARTLAALNDTILGITEENEITISGLDIAAENILRLVPLGDDVRGEGVDVNLAGYGGIVERSDNTDGSSTTVVFNNIEVILPKAPNTGRK